MSSSFTFLRVRGIPIGANWSWLLIFALVAWSLSTGLFPRTYPGLGDSAYIAMGLVTAVLFFTSILLHELGHAFRALKEGMEIEGITLWILGGVARFRGMFPSAGAEARIAIAGPVVTLVLAALFGLLTWTGNELAWPGAVVGVTDYLTRINAIVLGFNLVPALPLDGGRVLRAYLWHRQESFTAATMSAAKAGRAFGIVLIGLGVIGLFTGSGLGGIWFAFIGWFLLQAAQAEAAVATLRQALSGIDVADLMSPDPVSIRPDTTVDEFIEGIGDGRHSTFPVVDSSGELVGLMRLRNAANVPRERRSRTTVREVMLPLDKTPTVRPGSPVVEAVQRLQEGPGRAVVVSSGRPVGILSGSDVVRALELESVRARGSDPTARRVPRLVWVVVGLMMVGAAGYLFHPPVLVVAPGKALDVSEDISITGVVTDELNGSYLLTSVSLSQPNGLVAALALVRGRDILPLSAVIPEGVDAEEFLEQQQVMFRESRRTAAAAAARAVGLDVNVSGSGARVLGVAPGSPAAGELQARDVIRSVNGRRIQTSSELTDAIRSRPTGSEFTIAFERDGQRRSVTLRSRDLPETEGAVIGVVIQTADLEIDLPFEVMFEETEVGGPSAGSAYALAIADMLDDGDYARGRRIAATGTIALTGEIGPVGGVKEKALSARAADADLFLVPSGELNVADVEGLEMRGVETLSGAIAELT